jgi:hypothetical protein
MAEPVWARRLTDQEGQRLQQIVRRGKHGSIRVRRAMIIMASASGTPVPAIARLAAADEDTVRDVIVASATTRTEKLGLPFTHWSLRKLAAYLARNGTRVVAIGRERLRQISFQRTRSWKESTDPDKDAKLDQIEHVTSKFPDRCFAFDQFWPLSSGPATAPARPGRPNPGGCPPPVAARTGSATSTAATPSAMTCSGHHPPPQGRRSHPWPRWVCPVSCRRFAGRRAVVLVRAQAFYSSNRPPRYLARKRSAAA